MLERKNEKLSKYGLCERIGIDSHPRSEIPFLTLNEGNVEQIFMSKKALLLAHRCQTRN